MVDRESTNVWDKTDDPINRSDCAPRMPVLVLEPIEAYHRVLLVKRFASPIPCKDFSFDKCETIVTRYTTHPLTRWHIRTAANSPAADAQLTMPVVFFFNSAESLENAEASGCFGIGGRQSVANLEETD
jgi:hypothetical protein